MLLNMMLRSLAFTPVKNPFFKTQTEEVKKKILPSVFGADPKVSDVTIRSRQQLISKYFTRFSPRLLLARLFHRVCDTHQTVNRKLLVTDQIHHSATSIKTSTGY